MSLIDRVAHDDDRNFEAWLRTTASACPTLDIPGVALRFGVIPRRLLELVEDPRALDIDVKRQSASVAEWIDVSVFQRWPRTEDIYELFLSIRQSRRGHILWVAQYVDAVAFRHQHLSIAVFRRLQRFAAALKFDFMLGSHNASNSWFFTQACGGIRLSDLSEVERDEYFPDWRHFDPEFMAIQPLHDFGPKLASTAPRIRKAE